MIASDQESLRRVWLALAEQIEAQGPQEVKWSACKSTRSEAQNRCLWASLNDISRQVQWPVDGVMQKLSPDEWKMVLSAGLKQHQRVAMGVEGGFVILGQSTSKMTVRQMGDLLDLVYAFGNDPSRKVVWSSPEFKSLMEAERQ